MGKRIALCLSGIVGGTGGADGKGDMVDLYKIFNQYKKHILDLNEVDVFLHSWSVDVEDVVCDLYKPKGKKFEEQIMFHDINKGKHRNTNGSHLFYSRWYSINEAMKLKKEYEKENDFEYDMVMISRFDLLWFTDIDFENYDSKYFWISNWNHNGPGKRGPYGSQRKAGRGFLDFWFFSNSKDMDKFASLYDSVENGEFFKTYPSSDGGRTSSHVISKQYSNLLGLDSKETMYRGFDHEVYRRYNKHCGEKI